MVLLYSCQIHHMFFLPVYLQQYYKNFQKNLYTKNMPNPDILIRTGGRQRLSNFMLWQLAYAEFHFTSVLWPDFRGEHFLTAIQDFQNRERRFGGLLQTNDK